MTEKALRQFVTTAMRKGFFRESYHSEVERASRNIDLNDVVYGLERSGWKLKSTPDFDEEHGNWEYLIDTEDLEGDQLSLKIAAYPKDNRLVVVSKF